MTRHVARHTIIEMHDDGSQSEIKLSVEYDNELKTPKVCIQQGNDIIYPIPQAIWNAMVDAVNQMLCEVEE